MRIIALPTFLLIRFRVTPHLNPPPQINWGEEVVGNTNPTMEKGSYERSERTAHYVWFDRIVSQTSLRQSEKRVVGSTTEDINDHEPKAKGLPLNFRSTTCRRIALTSGFILFPVLVCVSFYVESQYV